MSAKITSPRAAALLRRAGVLLFYVALWAIAARMVNQPLLLPSPSSVIARLLELLPQGLFWKTLFGTLLRTLEAYALGILAAVVLGALCCRFALADALISPALSAARVPVLTGFLMTLPVVFSALTQAVRAIDDRLTEMAALYHFGRIGTLRHVILPSVLPAFAESCLASIGLCWKAVVAAEVIGVPKMAVGSKLYEAKIYLETDSLLAWTLMIVLLSVLLENLLRRLAAGVSEVRHD